MTRSELETQVKKSAKSEAMEVKSFRLPSELIGHLNILAKRLKTTESAIVRAAIEIALGKK